MLEFKLFAIRNPEAKRRFQKFIAKMIPPMLKSASSVYWEPNGKASKYLVVHSVFN
jgi:hypothetical protein